MTPRYMLDIDTCSYIMKRSSPAVLKRLEQVPPSDVCISVITKSELLYGVEVSPRRQQEAAAHYAKIRTHLKSRGTMIGANDLFIAAHARSLGLTLVTNNTGEFRRVPGLLLENWVAAS